MRNELVNDKGYPMQKLKHVIANTDVITDDQIN